MDFWLSSVFDQLLLFEGYHDTSAKDALLSSSKSDRSPSFEVSWYPSPNPFCAIYPPKVFLGGCCRHRSFFFATTLLTYEDDLPGGSTVACRTLLSSKQDVFLKRCRFYITVSDASHVAHVELLNYMLMMHDKYRSKNKNMKYQNVTDKKDIK